MGQNSAGCLFRKNETGNQPIVPHWAPSTLIFLGPLPAPDRDGKENVLPSCGHLCHFSREEPARDGQTEECPLGKRHCPYLQVPANPPSPAIPKLGRGSSLLTVTPFHQLLQMGLRDRICSLHSLQNPHLSSGSRN